ncbi:MAG: hypothetical protein Unbinned6316contig1000_26 [Prokaryotic dsDNA virus sp.]|nr:MAG: hypothetical protein Unbinned6316contig1000_26 [Prokaryotic dsDNA virus sp.]|tara:strand:- start:1754 stop:2125 length:372 start_codon:yes stop_codon:yes gene_type:complete
MEITGNLKKILPLENGVSKAGKEWKKQSCLIETDNEYNPIVCVSAFGEKVNDLNKLVVGYPVSILCNVYSREYNGKYYTSIDGYWFSTKNTESFDARMKDKMNEMTTEKSEFVEVQSDEDLPF